MDYDLDINGSISINSTIDLDGTYDWNISEFIEWHVNPTYSAGLNYLSAKRSKIENGSWYNIWGAHTIL